MLRECDAFVCSDISRNLLEVAKQNIKRSGFKCKFEFVKLEGKTPFQIPFDTESVDAITMNSVLHHIRDIDSLLKEVDRSLKPGGLLFIGNEPNKHFYQNRFLRLNYLILSLFYNPTPFVVSAMVKIGERTHTSNILRRMYHFLYPLQRKEYEVLKRIHNIVINEGLATSNLPVSEIRSIVDIRGDEGFVPESLLPEYDLLHIETYNHLSWVSFKHPRNKVLCRYEKFLERKIPRCGVTFFTVLRKPCG